MTAPRFSAGQRVVVRVVLPNGHERAPWEGTVTSGEPRINILGLGSVEWLVRREGDSFPRWVVERQITECG